MSGIEFSAGEIATMAALLGALTGAISFLFKALINSKDNVIHELLDERNYWRDMALARIEPNPPQHKQEPPQYQQHPNPQPPPTQQYGRPFGT
jgi:hypothetical protein